MSDGCLNRPHGIAVDGQDRVYVGDSQNHRIQMFTSEGAFLCRWGTGGSGPGQFTGLMNLTIDRSGNVFIVKSTNNRVQKFVPASVPVRTMSWGALKSAFEPEGR